MGRINDDRGETLIEILIALVVIGLVTSAYFATFSTQAMGSVTHRDLATEDGALRSYAELTKSAVRQQCDGSTPTFSVSGYSTPTGFSTPTLSSNVCPSVDTPLSVTVSIHKLPNDLIRTLDFAVRAP